MTDCLPYLNLPSRTGHTNPQPWKVHLTEKAPSFHEYNWVVCGFCRPRTCLPGERAQPALRSFPFITYLTSPSLRPLPDHAPLLNTPDLHPAFPENSRLPSHCFLFIQPGPPFIQLAPSKYPFGCLSRSSLHRVFIPLAEPYPTSVTGDPSKKEKKKKGSHQQTPLSASRPFLASPRLASHHSHNVIRRPTSTTILPSPSHRPASARTQPALAGCLTGIA